MNLNKVITTIAGFSPCSDFNYACYVTENLANLLPNFSVKIIIKSFPDWKEWLEDKCKENNWSHNKSPLIWRESGVRGSKPVYIGGRLDFEKFINHYYGIDVTLSETEMKNLSLDYLFVQNLVLKNELEGSKSNAINITILGAGCSCVCLDLITKLASLKEISKNGIVINLHDELGELKDVVKDAESIDSDSCSINYVENISDSLKHCNVLIILDYIVRDELETSYQWLNRNYESSKELAEQINLYAPPDVKVILCSMGPTCFCANVIAKFATKLDKNQVVAVSAHYGLEAMHDIAKSLDIDIKSIGCPPVWGFLGISQYIDVLHTLQKFPANIPNRRDLEYLNSTHPLESKYTELRWLFYLAFDNKGPHKLFQRKSLYTCEDVGSKDLSRCKAICDLLSLWYSKDETNIGDEIITLGISSDGTFNIPKNVYFSQPVHLKILDDNSRVWLPCPEFPFSTDHPTILINLMETAKLILENMSLID